jgi:hypothetical protein
MILHYTNKKNLENIFVKILNSDDDFIYIYNVFAQTEKLISPSGINFYIRFYILSLNKKTKHNEMNLN